MKQKNIYILLLLLVLLSFLSFQNQDNNETILSDVDILIKEGNYSKALSLLLAEFNKNPQSSAISEKIASIFFSQQVFDLALKYYLISYKNGIVDVQVIEKIGECYAYLNNNKKAIEYLKKAFFMGNSDPYYLYSLIWVLLKEKKFDEANSYLEFGNSMYPNLSYFVGAKALFYANTFDIEEARKEYEKAILLTASYSPIYFYNWGVMEFQLRNYAKAEELFLGAASFNNFGEAFLALGEISLGKADLNLAEKYFLRGKPLLKSPFILYDLIYLYGIKGEKDKLISVYKSIIKFPNKWWIYQYNLNLYEQLMNFYELENQYYKTLYNLEKKTFYSKTKDKIKSQYLAATYIIYGFISKVKFKFYSILHLGSINKNIETLNYYNVSRKALSDFRFIENKLILNEKETYTKITNKEGYIYNLYFAQNIKNRKEKIRLAQLFIEKADSSYERLDIINALELMAKANKGNIDTYIEILGKIAKILPYYFNSSGLKIPVYIKYSGNGESINILKKYLKTKGIINNKTSKLKVNISCSDIYTFVIEYENKTNFFSFTKEDILNDRISIYYNFFSVFYEN